MGPMVDGWTAAEVDRVQAATSLPQGRMRLPVPMPPSPRGTLPGGQADFRGFPLTELRAISIAEADFTGARAPDRSPGPAPFIRLDVVDVERSVFDRAGRFHRLHGQFRACSFRRITTQGCSLAGTFTDSDFSGANFKGAFFGARFVRCRFHDCNLHLATWAVSSFQDCEFGGAAVHPIFADVREVALGSERATFTVTMSRVLPGEFR